MVSGNMGPEYKPETITRIFSTRTAQAPQPQALYIKPYTKYLQSEGTPLQGGGAPKFVQVFCSSTSGAPHNM